MSQQAGGAAAGGAAAGGAGAGGAGAAGAGAGGSGAGAAAASGAAQAAAGSVVATAAAGTAAAAAAGAGAGAGGAAAGGQSAAAAAGGAAAGTGQGAGDQGAAGGSGEGAAAAAGTLWAADWRESYAKDDPAKLNVLKRYTSPTAALDALFAAQQKIRSGETKQALPENATPEQLATFRQENGIPDKPEGYFEKLPAELKLKDTDKTVLTPYLTAMHELNLPPATAARLIQVRQQELDRLVEGRSVADDTLKTQTEDSLRKEWGNDYRANINSIHGMLNGAPKEVSEAILNARTPDGNPLVGTLEVNRWLAQLSRELNPFGTIVPAGGGGALTGQGVDARIAEIETSMKQLNGPYYKGPKAEGTQKEYRDLIAARDRMKARTAA